MPIQLPALFSNASNPVGGSTPFKWNDTPPTNISVPSQELLDYSEMLNSSIQEEQAISSTINFSGEIDNIIRKNSEALGLRGGANGFYDISLVKSGAFVGDNIPSASYENRIADQEPDGFRLYLIAPPRPAVEVATAALGNGAVGLGNLAASTTDAMGNAIQSETTTTIISTVAAASDNAGITENATETTAKTVQDYGKSVKESGEKIKQIAASIKKYMDDAGANFNKDFNNYVQKAYNEYPDGSAFYSIVLPMPNELTDQHGHDVDSIMMGLAPRLLAGLGTGMDILGKSGKDKNLRRATGLTNTALQKMGAVIGGVAAEAGSYAVDTAKLALGVGLNPNVEQVYANPRPRQFQFTFNLPIKSEQEGKQVRDFIDRLKQHSYPFSVLGIGGQNQLYLYPGEVYFEFSGRFRNQLFRSLRPCIITDIQVGYKNSSDQYQHFADGSTIEYVVTIGLLENRLLDRNILVDDAEKYSNETLANKNYRDQVKYRDTIFRKDTETILSQGRLPTMDDFAKNFDGTLGTARGAGQQ